MRYAFLFLLCLFCLEGRAQTRNLHFKSYRDKNIFIQTLLYSFVNIPPQGVIDTLSGLKATAAAYGDSEMVNELNLFIYEAELNLHNPTDTTEQKIKKIIAYARNNNMRYIEADALNVLGHYYNNERLTSASMEQYITSYHIYKNFSDFEFPSKQFYLYELGSKFGSLEDYDNAIKYSLEALHTHTDIPVDLYCALYNNIGLSYRYEKKYDSAIYYFKAGYNYSIKTGNKPYTGITIGNIGITYFLQGKYDEAIPLIKQDIENSILTTQIKNAINSMGVLATIYNYRHQYDSAETTLQKALNMGRVRPFWPDYRLAEPIYEQLHILYSARKDFRKASLYADSTLIAKDSAAALKSGMALAKAHDQLEYAQHKLESEKLQNQVKIAQLEISKNRTIIVSSIAGVTILLIVLIFIARLNSQVRKQRNELESLNDVKNKIFSIISHDLRTPVNSLVSFTQLLEHGSIPPEKLNKYASVLKDNLGYTAELMENLLNWARSQMQGYKPVLERFDIAETAHQTIGLLHTEAENKSIVIVNNIPTNTIVLSDINMTSLIIRNLLSNAVKYTPEGGTITLSEETVKDRVFIKVKDTGIGIPKQSVDEFNKSMYAQPLASTRGTNQEKGTGLGLMLCKSFAGLMNGSIVLESEPGKGSVFILVLPHGN